MAKSNVPGQKSLSGLQIPFATLNSHQQFEQHSLPLMTAVPWEGKPGDPVFSSAGHRLPTGGEGQQQLSSLAPLMLE